MAKLNKFEHDQLNQINEGRGIFSAFWKKLTSSRLKKQLKKMESDPYMRDALKKLNRSIDDFEREVGVQVDINSSIDKADLEKDNKNVPGNPHYLRNYFKKLGYKF